MSNDRQPPQKPDGTPNPTSVSFSAGRDNKGAFAIGNYATATATLTETVTPDQGIDITATLEALRVQLAQIAGVDTKALTRLDEAKEEAAKDDAEPAEITTLVDQATRYATKAAGFAAAAGQVAPLAKQVWNWAGTALPDWIAALGPR
jgi:hypothetical protein